MDVAEEKSDPKYNPLVCLAACYQGLAEQQAAQAAPHLPSPLLLRNMCAAEAAAAAPGAAP